MEEHIKAIISAIGEDPTREGLRDTPTRVARAYKEMTKGYQEDPAQILCAVFSEPCDEMIVVEGIKFYSLCEHHLLPFFGEAIVGYIPNSRVVGVSKLVRLVDCFARRLQIQERLTQQVVQAMQQYLNPLGAGAIFKAHHMCMSCRGVRREGSQMITSALLGALRQDPASRAEFLALRCK